MELSPSQIEKIQHQFEGFCCKVLRNENCSFERDWARRAEKEICFSALPSCMVEEFLTEDSYSFEHTCFFVMNQQIIIQNEKLADALCSLTLLNQWILLLSFFEEMNDREIAEALNLYRSTVQRRRTRSIKELRIKLEVIEDESE